MDPEIAKLFIPEPSFFNYKSEDVIVYALGIGATTKEELHFIYEGHPEFQVFPTFVVVPGFLAQTSNAGDWPGANLDFSRLLHGEHYIELFNSIPADGGKLRTETRVLDILDKGKAALIIKEVTTYDCQTNEKLAVQEFGIFLSGAGGFGGNRTSPHERKSPPFPERPPDTILEDRIHPDQSALYRIGSGDLNPLHIDPDFAQMAGFSTPILHGLCSLGFATRLILCVYGDKLAKNLRSVRCRFSSPVIPGQTLVVEMWQNQNQILFTAKIKETGKVAISNGCIELNEVSVNQNLGEEPSSVNTKLSVPLKSKAIFDVMGKELAETNESLKPLGNALILYEIGSEGEDGIKSITKYILSYICIHTECSLLLSLWKR
uniref:MaoC-like domain-containing protein n=1 Tax=Meloidogyne incognita TaxID=6306 RepID=A0A914KWE2_MELIC